MQSLQIVYKLRAKFSFLKFDRGCICRLNFIDKEEEEFDGEKWAFVILIMQENLQRITTYRYLAIESSDASEYKIDKMLEQ